MARGAKLVFVDIRPDTMNIDETKIEEAITDRTRVIAVVHYAGVACEMDTIMDIARRHGLKVVEDAAQAVGSYYKGKALGTVGVETQTIPAGCAHYAHMYYIKTRDLAERTALISHLKALGILAVFHYIPLHSSPAGLKFGRFAGEDVWTTKESERLLRLPLYYGITPEDRATVIDGVLSFYAR